MADVQEILTREVGPLPVWGWGVGIVGGFFLSKKMGGLFGGGSSEGAADVSDNEAAVSPANAGGYFGGGSGVVTSYPNYGAPPAADEGLTDNDQWRDRAIRLLREEGYGALTVDAALTRWLSGATLTADQGAIVDQAILRAGFPPYPPTQSGGIVPTETPAPPPPANPPAAQQPGPSEGPQQITPNHPAPPLPANHLPGEEFVDFANAANGGTWWLTNWGGVYAVGGAPYKGNPIQDRVAPDLAGQRFTGIKELGGGTGYMVIDNRADTGSYHYP